MSWSSVEVNVMKTVLFIHKGKHSFVLKVFLLVVHYVHNLNWASGQTTQKGWAYGFLAALLFFSPFAFWNWDSVSKHLEALFEKGLGRPSVEKHVMWYSHWGHLFLFTHSESTLPRRNRLPVSLMLPNTSWSVLRYLDLNPV